MREKLIKLLKKHEGCKLFPYRCIAGYLTIGYGRNLDTRGISKEESKKMVYPNIFAGITIPQAEYLLNNDIDYFTSELYKRIKWLESKPESIRIALIDLSFNIGVSGVLKFRNTLELIRVDEYKKASIEILKSKWAEQVKGRAIELAEMIKNA